MPLSGKILPLDLDDAAWRKFTPPFVCISTCDSIKKVKLHTEKMRKAGGNFRVEM
jgi:hypothetical protein